MAHRAVILVIAASALWIIGTASQAAQPDKGKCTEKCEKQEETCRYYGTDAPKCFTKFRVCNDSCIRTGKPISFGLIR